MEVLVKGKVTLLDESDLDYFNTHSWRIVNGYVARSKRIGKRVTTIFLHNDLLDTPEGYEGEHKNNNKLDNQRSNLRIATHAQNCQNRRKSNRNTSGYVGVNKKKGRNKWRVQVTVGGKHYCLGAYWTVEEAVKVRDAKAAELHGEFAKLNGLA